MTKENTPETKESGTVPPLSEAPGWAPVDLKCERVKGIEVIKCAAVEAAYRSSVTQVWTPQTNTVTRIGLCIRCDAAIYGAGKGNTEIRYHAVQGGLVLLPNAQSEPPRSIT